MPVDLEQVRRRGIPTEPTGKENGRGAEAHRPNFFCCEVPATAKRSPCHLQRLNVGGLQALGAADDLKLDRLAVVQRAIAIGDDRGEMDENVLSGLALDETKALAGIKPLHCSLFFVHFFVSLFD